MAEFNLTPKEARQKLAEALRSGKYNQARGRLGSPRGHRCLGVACEVFMQAEYGMRRACDGQEHPGFLFCIDQSSHLALPPPEIVEWLGAKTASEPRDNTLVSMNDSGRTFDEIADIVESEEEIYAY